MWIYSGPLKKLHQLMERLGPCGNAGFIIGAWAGGLVSLLSLTHGGVLAPTYTDLLFIIVILSLFCWCLLLFIYVVLMKYKISSVWARSLVFSVLICALTILFVSLIGNYLTGIIAGIMAGLFVGFVLCGRKREIIG